MNIENATTTDEHIRTVTKRANIINRINLTLSILFWEICAFLAFKTIQTDIKDNIPILIDILKLPILASCFILSILSFRYRNKCIRQQDFNSVLLTNIYSDIICLLAYIIFTLQGIKLFLYNI